MIRVRFPAYQLNAWILSCFLFLSVVCGESIRVATYNLDNYLVTTRYVEGVRRPSYPKPEAEKAAVRSTIQEAMPDILVLQEIGPLPFLKELQADLAQEGIIYSHAIHMQGDDTVRHLAVLSTQAPVEVVRHQDLAFKYQDQSALVKRGMLELSFHCYDGKLFKVFVIHLKSRRTNINADPQSLQRRTLEAEACRDRIIERTFEMGVMNFMIVGDFNDHPASAPLRRFYRKGDLEIGTLLPASDSRSERWTHYYNKEVLYSLVDGFVVSDSLLTAIKDGRGHIIDTPHVLNGSDHRMVYLDLNP